MSSIFSRNYEANNNGLRTITAHSSFQIAKPSKVESEHCVYNNIDYLYKTDFKNLKNMGLMNYLHIYHRLFIQCKDRCK